MGRARRPLEERFWESVDKTEECWLWTGHLKRGYGSFFIPGKPKRSVGAHRFSYELMVAPIPEGLTIDHLCRVKTCVRPDHLEPVTAEENHRRWAVTLTACSFGHEFTTENTYWKPDGSSRKCRECMRRLRRKYRQSQKQAKAATFHPGTGPQEQP